MYNVLRCKIGRNRRFFMKKAVIIGASSGMGRELAVLLSKKGYALGLAARRLELLDELAAELGGEVHTARVDTAEHTEAIKAVEALLEKLGGADLFVISSATGRYNPRLDWDIEEKQLTVNVLGFAAMANVGFKHLSERPGGGALVGISSFACLRGSPQTESYSASKAFVSNYMEGLRMRTLKQNLPVKIVDIRPGFIDTPMTKGQKGMFWLVSAKAAAADILRAAERGRSIAYVPSRWIILARIVRNLPDFIYKKV